jgi:hypothetical protein
MFTNSASAGALGRVNEHSGFAVASAHYIVFVELKHARPFRLLRPFEVPHEASQATNSPPSSASIGPMPNTCLQAQRRSARASWRLHGRLDATRSAPHSARRRFEHPVPYDPRQMDQARPLSLLTVWTQRSGPSGVLRRASYSRPTRDVASSAELLAGSRAHGYPLRHRDRRVGTGVNGCPLQTGLFVLWLPIGIEGTVTAGCSNNKYRRRQDPRHAMRGPLHRVASQAREPSGSSIGARDRGG